MTEAGLLEAAQLDEIEAEAKALIDEAVAEAEGGSRRRPQADLLTDVYVKY